MSGLPGLDWIALTLSLLNAFLLLWLAFTILFETDSRTIGIWLAVDGLFLGAAFFIAHSAILENGSLKTFPGINFWWQAGWWPVILSPFAWYAVILWYAGYWDDPSSNLHKRQAPWFGLILIFTAGLLAWMVLANPLPDISLRDAPSSSFILLAFVFPVYIILCILLALDAIIRPGPTARLLGDAARKRARPWLTASTIVLLIVSLLVSLALIWGVNSLGVEYEAQTASSNTYYSLTIFDLIIEILITTAILLIGQAAMTYEVFSSHPLPRNGLRQRWLFAVGGGMIFSGIMALVLVLTFRAEPIILIFIPAITLLMTIQNREVSQNQAREADQFRALIGSEESYEGIFLRQQPNDLETSLQEGMKAIVGFIQSKNAVIMPSGVMANFLPETFGFPPDSPIPAGFLDSFSHNSITPLDSPIAIDPASNNGYCWAIALRSTRGLEVWLFVSEHRDGGYYTMEEMLLARSASERLMDTQAAAEVARRLVTLQRKQQGETRLLDQKARRILHDEVLPLLHTVLLTDQQSPSKDQITSAHRQIAQLLKEAPQPIPVEIEKIGLVALVQHTAEKEAAFLDAELTFTTSDQADVKVNSLSPEAAEAVYYAFRESLRNIEKYSLRTPVKPLKIGITIDASNIFKLQVTNTGTSHIWKSSTSIESSGQGILLHNALLTVFGGGMKLNELETGVTVVTITLPI
jgi:hypothetical protein